MQRLLYKGGTNCECEAIVEQIKNMNTGGSDAKTLKHLFKFGVVEGELPSFIKLIGTAAIHAFWTNSESLNFYREMGYFVNTSLDV